MNLRTEDPSETGFQHGIWLFNEGHFFDAHEVLEDVWRAEAGARRGFLQALVQAAVGLHHYSTGNLIGARSVLERSARNLEPYGEHCGGVAAGALRRELLAFRAQLHDLRAGDSLRELSLPRIVLLPEPPAARC